MSPNPPDDALYRAKELGRNRVIVHDCTEPEDADEPDDTEEYY